MSVLDDLSGLQARATGRARLRPAPGVRFVLADVRDHACLAELGSFDVVVHLAALVGVRRSIEEEKRYEEVNVGGTRALLRQMRHRRTRFVFASSSSVYGARTTGPFQESDPLLPASPYARTKRDAEELLLEHHERWGTPATSLRFFTVYGPGQRPDMAVSRFVHAALRADAIPLYGDGSSRRDYTYVDDIVGGVLAAVDCDDASLTTYNLGSGRPVELRGLIDAVGRATGTRPRVAQAPDQPGDVPLTHADLTRAGRDLGYRPQTSLDDGLRRYVASLAEHRWWEKRDPTTVVPTGTPA